jgi:signal transduction histidine kinase
MKLAGRLMLVFLVAVMLMTAVASYLTVSRAYDRFEQQERALAQEVTRRMDDELIAAWRRQGIEGLAQTLARLVPDDGQLHVRWVWSEHVPALGAAASLGTGPQEMASLLVEDESGEQHLRVYCPVSVENGRYGALEFTRSLRTLQEQTRDTLLATLTLIGMMSAVAVGMVYYAGIRWIAQPLERLIEKTRRVGRGDFAGPLAVHGHDELSELARALNQMCDQLGAQQIQLQTEAAKRLATMEQLRHADRLKTVGRLAAGIAHEMGTPLNVVSGRAALMASGRLSPEELQSSAQAIKSEAERITVIIRQLLDFARQRTPHRTDIDLRELVERTLDLLQPIAEKHRVTLQAAANSISTVVHADAGQMQQVLTNLVMNAIQSMPRGGQVQLRFEQRRVTAAEVPVVPDGRYLALSILDQGVGIPAENLDQVFEPFFTTKSIGEGTGLGLSIAYGIVREHGGWIEVRSEVGRGSCFTLYLPQELDRCTAGS